MRTYTLTFTAVAAAVVAVALIACTGGAVTDASGKNITNTGGSYAVEFFNPTTRQFYNTTVDDQGFFGFDYYAPSGGGNVHVAVPEGTYQIVVYAPAPHDAGAITYSSPYMVQHVYATSGCPDHYTGTEDEYCALYQLKLLPPGSAAAAPYTASLGSLPYTVVTLTADN